MYVISTLEEEVIQGIFNCPGDPNKRCCWLKRTFTDLHTQRASDPAMRIFSDLTLEGAEVDQEAQKTLAHLKEARMTAKYTGWGVTVLFLLFAFPVVVVVVVVVVVIV